jgi:predicted membrane-bound spermidine synthase
MPSVRAQFVRASLVVFIASFCTLVIELVAGRILAPYVGVSLYTWTSIIGVVLAGISAGAWAGGWLADRRPRESTLGWLLLASGAAAMLIVPASAVLAADEGWLSTAGIATTLVQRVVVLSFLLFFLPAFLLGTISPVAVKLAVMNLETAGSVVGKIYAFSTLGAIAGTYVTGFWLVAAFGTRATILGVGVTLLLTAILLGGILNRRVALGTAAVVITAALAAPFALRSLPPPGAQRPLAAHETGTLHFEESQYYTIRVERSLREDTAAPLHELHLDHLIHSYSDPADPAFLSYGYLQVFNELVRQRPGYGDPLRLLFIGGGGYTLPRLLERSRPDASIDVVEIDPAVTRVAKRWFGVPAETRIRSFNEDARWFAMRRGRPYHLIFLDAFNDLSVPYHLTTREFTSMLDRLMTPDAILAVNVIDDWEVGRFLASYVRTLQDVFGAGNVAVLLEDPGDLEAGRSTFVVIASPSPLPRTAERHVIAGADLDLYVQRRNGIVLTDDFAPVDNMLAPLFAERYRDEHGE